MKEELKKYIKNQVSNYHVTVPLDYLLSKIERWIEEYNLDLDPPYQRGYVWTHQQKKEYVEYILRLGEDQSISGNQFYFNHPGWMGNFYCGKFEAVDGKQRLNALMEWVQGKWGVFEEDIYFNPEEAISLSNITLSFNVAKLQTKEEIVDWYISMNTGGTMHTSEDIQKALDYKNS